MQAWLSIASQGHHNHFYRTTPPKRQHKEEKRARACTLREMPFDTRASPNGETPSVAPVEYDNHPSVVTWRGEVNNIPRRQTPLSSGASPRKLHRNQVIGTHHIFTEGGRYGFERSTPTARLSPVAAKVGDVRLAGGDPNECLMRK